MRYTFGDYVLDTDRYELRRAGMRLALGPKAFEVLTYLLQHRGRAVTKEELLERLWPQQFVSESVLTSCILLVRKAIGDSGSMQQCIETVRGRGYRFIARVEEGLSAGVEGEALAPPRAAPLDPEVLLEVGPDYQAMCAEIVQRFAGHVAQSQSDRLEESATTILLPPG